MIAKSKIEWTESTWNPVTGCTKISMGCQNCYAERMAKRLKLMGQHAYRNGFELTVQEDKIEQPLKMKQSQSIFVNSMSDLFHENLPEKDILRIFDVMNRAHWHRFQVLTKRARRLEELAPKIKWSENIWMGVTVEHSDYLWRIDCLRNVPAAVRFLSLEPLLGSLAEMNLSGIDWAIAGGESGPGARVMEQRWVEEIRDICLESNVPFFFKQWGGVNKKRNGRLLGGRTWDEMPDDDVFEKRLQMPRYVKKAELFGA